VPVINAAFGASAEEIAEAEAVVAAFAANPGAGVVGLGGAMLDLPHLRRAEAVLAMRRG
jgi:citrate lyase subunit beta/citryl-CoA lyase